MGIRPLFSAAEVVQDSAQVGFLSYPFICRESQEKKENEELN